MEDTEKQAETTAENDVDQSTPHNDIDKIKADERTAILAELDVDSVETAKANIAAYKKTVEESKTELEKATESRKAAEIKANEYLKRAETAEACLAAVGMGVLPENAKDLVVIAMAKTTPQKDLTAVIKDLKGNAAYSGFFSQAVEALTGTGNPVGGKGVSGKTGGFGEYLAKAAVKNTNVKNPYFN